METIRQESVNLEIYCTSGHCSLKKKVVGIATHVLLVLQISVFLSVHYCQYKIKMHDTYPEYSYL